MKKYFANGVATRVLVAAALTGFSGVAIAADAVVSEMVPVAPAISEGYDWSGVYLGAELGYGWGKSDSEFNDPTNTPYVVEGLDPEGVIGGVFAGYNYQLQNGLVLGVEGDFTFSDMSREDVLGRQLLVPGAPPQIIPGVTSDARVDWTASVRGRVGYAAGRWMPFITAGYAVADYEYELRGQGVSYSESDTLNGWTVGAGVEYAATDKVIVRAQYRYSDFGDVDLPGVTPGLINNVDLQTHDVRIGLSYKF